jgi:hypothetical protein
VKVIQELVAYFERRGKLTPEQIDHLLKQGLLAAEAPTHMVGLCDQPGQSYYFRVKGDLAGTVWGTDVYTGDSALAAAAVHAGVVKPDESRVIKVTVVLALQQYVGSLRNGVTSQDYGPYGTAYRVEAV